MQQPTKSCAICGITFEKKPTTSITRWQKQQYCSWPCRARAVGQRRVGRQTSLETRRKQSLAMRGPRNHRYGVTPSAEATEKRIAGVTAKTSNERHHFWKGDTASMSTLHAWLNRRYPRAGRCEQCGQTRRTQYANLKDHQYTRNREDYAELCVPCHQRLDRRRDSGTGRFVKLN